MIYYFGWIVLSLDLENDDATEGDRRQMLAKVDDILEPHKPYLQLCERRQQNYLETLFMSSAHNHNTGYKDDVLAIYESIGKIAPASYGLLYIRDEHAETHNEFIVYRLAKGILTKHEDHLLSPCMPTIELDR